MLQKIKEAISIFSTHAGLLMLIVLSVRLPINILSDFIIFNLPPAKDNLAYFLREQRIDGLLGAIFDPIYLSAVIYACSHIYQNRIVTYREAMTVGLQNWIRLFMARFLAGLVIFLGLLILIIPGVLLAIRYALIEPVVLFEGVGNVSSSFLKRSTYLTRGMRWKIFKTIFVFAVAVFGLSILMGIIIYVPLTAMGLQDNIFISIIFASLIDVILSILPIIIYLFYRQATVESMKSYPLSLPPSL